MIRLSVRQLEYFEVLAEALHFGRAAELAGVSQPALSAQIAEMEARLGCKLFERGGRSVALTQEAVAMRPRVDRILTELRELQLAAQMGRIGMEGRFRLGIIPTVAPYLLPVALPRLKERFPALTLDLREAVTATLVEETAAGRLDAFVAAMPLDQPGLTTETLFDDLFYLAVPASDRSFVSPPVPPESPALERLMLLEEGHCMRDQALAVCGSARPSTLANYGATSLTTLLHMVAHGLGITLVPEMAVAPASDMRDVRVIPFAEPMPSRTLCLAWRRASQRAAECRTLAGILRELKPSSDQAGKVEREPEPQKRDHHGADLEGAAAVGDAV